MYNHTMKRQSSRKRLAMGLLILGMAFLTLGLATDQTVFTWLSIVFVLISLIMGGKWLGRR
jgi:hypothetical protein